MGSVTGGVKPSILGDFHTGTGVFDLLSRWYIFDSIWGVILESILESIFESFWSPFWSHFGDLLESILETFWSPFWNGKRKIHLSGTERILSDTGVH